MTEPVRVLHLTDPHLFADTGGELRGVVTYDSLSRVLEHYRQGDWRADYAVATGDLIQDDTPGAYAHFADLVGSLGLPVYVTPGNHDVPELLDEALDVPPFHINDSFEAGDWLVIGLNTYLAGTAGGGVSASELARVDTLLDSSSAAHAMVCLHHPPVPMGSRWLDSVGLENAETVLERLSHSGRVRTVLFGHVHQAYDAMHDGMRLLATPSTCRQFKPHCEEFTVDDRPPAYRRIELGPAGKFETEIVWL